MPRSPVRLACQAPGLPVSVPAAAAGPGPQADRIHVAASAVFLRAFRLSLALLPAIVAGAFARGLPPRLRVLAHAFMEPFDGSACIRKLRQAEPAFALFVGATAKQGGLPPVAVLPFALRRS